MFMSTAEAPLCLIPNNLGDEAEVFELYTQVRIKKSARAVLLMRNLAVPCISLADDLALGSNGRRQWEIWSL